MTRKTSCRRLLSLMLGGAAFAANATIAPGPSGNGELFLVIQDAVAQISYTVDLGVRMDAFFVAAQQDEGVQRFWAFDAGRDADLQSFLNQTQPGNYVWAVMGVDSLGPVIGSNQRLFTTARQGDEAKIAATLNASFRGAIGTAGMNNFLNAVNISGTHGVSGSPVDYDVNGSSVNNITDPGTGYFGEPGGTGPRLAGNALSFDTTNLVGSSSWFYFLGSTAANGTVSVDEFDNLGTGSAGDGYFGFTFVDPNTNPASPYAGRYLLSYTLAPALQQALATTAAGRARASLTEYLAGSPARRIAAPAGEYDDYVPPSIEAPALPTLLPVPEPGALLLFAAGALALLRRRRQAA